MKMKKQLLFCIVALIGINCYSQISFEKGYYINNSNQKVNCLIKNYDWKNNPIDFEYKILETDQEKKASLKSIKEFGIYNISKYVRKTVNIDKSSEIISSLSTQKNPVFIKEQLFLKVLVEGKGSLYSYKKGNLIKFFFTNESSNIEQLIFKSYKTSDYKIAKNNRFKQQLWTDLKCSSIEMKTLEDINYKKNELIRFFIKYNNCENEAYINYDKKQKRDLFNLNLRPRLSSSSLAVNNPNSYRSTDFGSKISFGFGVEAEIILPFNKNKWAVILEPTFRNFKADKTTESSRVFGGKLIAEANYSSIEVPIGIRHYFFLKNNSKIFINAALIFDFNTKSSIEFKRADSSSLNNPLKISAKNNLGLGIGYKSNYKISLEIRYQTTQEILDSTTWTSNFDTFSVIFGYTLF